MSIAAATTFPRRATDFAAVPGRAAFSIPGAEVLATMGGST